jgi:hypothetical protein
MSRFMSEHGRPTLFFSNSAQPPFVRGVGRGKEVAAGNPVCDGIEVLQPVMSVQSSVDDEQV